MNYPIWSLPAKGLLIAAVAIVHVFVSHFAVGGGLFLVLAERKARRERDQALLGYVRAHSRFFILLTLVMGTITGVGIWFTIGLVHPEATASLIHAFLWAWAIEWTFFVTEIAAAMVYYYGWDRLDARAHEAVGWIYFVSAWLSLVVISGILSFMLTPGAWVRTHGFLAGLLNPSFIPSVLARTAAAFGLAGLYALLTASRLRDTALKEKVARYAGRWVLPMALVLPVAIVLYLGAAFLSGIPLGEPLGGPGGGIGGIWPALLHGSTTGNPIFIRAVRVVFVASFLTLLLTVAATRLRPRRYGLPLALGVLACAFAAIGAGEWSREDLRKPYVIGNYMFVNGVRDASAVPDTAASLSPAPGGDPFSLPVLQRDGVTRATLWHRPASLMPADMPLEREGEEIFRVLCTGCHTIDGYNAVRPLVRSRRRAELENTLEHLDTWRGRRMPPFAGNAAERRALAAFLERLGGTPGPSAGEPALLPGDAPAAPAPASLSADGPPTIAIPHPVPLPLPGPAWLLSSLLTLTFVLHVLPMNLLLGGSIIGLGARLRARRQPHAARLAALVTSALPVLVAATVTMGVAALLFLQVLYGRLFFTAAILLAVPWIAVVPVLMAGYSATYAARPSAGLHAWLAASALIAIAFVFANTLGLMSRPQEFLPLFQSSASGLHLNVADPTVPPRILHVLLAALAVSGLAVAVAGSRLRRSDAPAGEWMARHGVYWCAGATVLNLLPGFWWLAALPRETLLQFMGRDPVVTGCFTLAILAAIAALGLAIPSAFAPRPGRLAVGAAACLAASVVLMVLVRDAARRSLLDAAGFRRETWVAPQWGAIVGFSILLLAAVAMVWWMVAKLVKSGAGESVSQAGRPART